MNQKQFFN